MGLDLSKRVRRAVWYTQLTPYVQPRSYPPVFALDSPGSSLFDADRPPGSSLPSANDRGLQDRDIAVRRLIVPGVVLGQAGGANWLGDDASGWVAGWNTIDTPESWLVYTGAMRPGPIGESLSYIGGTGLIPCVNVATNQKATLQGPTHWRDFTVSFDVQYSPPVENVGTYYTEAVHTVGGMRAPTLVCTSNVSGNEFGNYFSVWFGDWGAGQRAARYCLLFQLPSWAPVLYCSYGPDAPPHGTVNHPAYNKSLGEWQALRLVSDAREHFNFETGRPQEIHFEVRRIGSNVYLNIQPGGDPKVARFTWSIDNAQSKDEITYQRGAELEKYRADLSGLEDGDRYSDHAFPAGRIYVDTNGAENLQFVMRMELENVRTTQAKSLVRQVTFSQAIPWSTLRAMVRDGGQDTDDALNTVEQQISDSIMNGAVTVGAYPIYRDQVDFTQWHIESAHVEVSRPTSAAGPGPECYVTVRIMIAPGQKSCPGGGPQTHWYPYLTGLRLVVDPFSNGQSYDQAQTGGNGASAYIHNGVSYSFSADAKNDVRLGVEVDTSDTAAKLAVTLSDPTTGGWTQSIKRVSLEDARGFPQQLLAGYVYVEAGVEKYRLWPVCSSYIARATYTASPGSQKGKPSIVSKLDCTGRKALAEKSRAFSLPAVDSYSHFWAMRMLAHYIGIDDLEMAPWRAAIYGPYAAAPYTLAGQRAHAGNGTEDLRPAG